MRDPLRFALVMSVLVVAACGGDDERIPPVIDAPTPDAATIDAPVTIDAPAIDAGVDGPAIDAAIDALAIDASAFDVNGCTLATATDLTAAGTPTVTFGGAAGFVYAPKCARISVGQAVTFSGTFASHPLRAGVVVGGVPQPQPGGPIASTDTGTTATFTFPAAGVFPYYCSLHGGGGMNGVVYVQ